MSSLKCALCFAGGVALGVVGACALVHGKMGFKPMVGKLIGHGLEVKDAIASKADSVREGVEDMMAEARAASEQRKNQHDQHHQHEGA